MRPYLLPSVILSGLALIFQHACSLAIPGRSSYVSYTSEENGLSIQYPTGWLIDDIPASILLSTSPGLVPMDEASFAHGEAVILLIVARGVALSDMGEDLVDILSTYSEIGLELTEPPTEDAHHVTSNGKTFAIAAYDITSPGPVYPNFLAAYGEGRTVVFATAHTSVDYQAEFRPLFEGLLASIQFRQPDPPPPGPVMRTRLDFTFPFEPSFPGYIVELASEQLTIDLMCALEADAASGYILNLETGQRDDTLGSCDSSSMTLSVGIEKELSVRVILGGFPIIAETGRAADRFFQITGDSACSNCYQAQYDLFFVLPGP